MERQRITHSRAQSFKGCRRRHWFEYEVGMRREVDGKALRMGSIFHEGLDVLKRGDLIDQAACHARSLYLQLPVPTDEAYARDLEYEQATVVGLLAGYAWRWIDQALHVLATEQSFDLPLLNPATGRQSTKFSLAGKIDGIVQLEDGRLAVLEHKTVSEDISLEADYWHRLLLDHQATIYVYAARQLGWNVSTVLWDAIRKPTIRPTNVPILDEDGKKIVIDQHGNRVFNRMKPKKKCPDCHGQGLVADGSDCLSDCPCTIGAPRQTGSTEDDYTLLTRPMTADEWTEKLLADMGERPDYYYARREIARLDTDIDQCMHELWDLQRTIADAQRLDRWYRTVSTDTCPYCPFFGLCASGWQNGDPAPEGFKLIEDRHPELTQVAA